jgi:hypothetical protein
VHRRRLRLIAFRLIAAQLIILTTVPGLIRPPLRRKPRSSALPPTSQSPQIGRPGERIA